MCLDENSFALVHKLLLKLKNLLSLVHLIQKHSDGLHSKHGQFGDYCHIWSLFSKEPIKGYIDGKYMRMGGKIIF